MEIAEERKKKIYDKIKEWFKDPYNKIFFAIFVFSIIIRLYFFWTTRTQPVWWDEADYLSSAKSLGGVMNIDYFFNPRRPFLLPLIWGIMLKLGLGEIGLRLTEFLFSIAMIPAMYLVTKAIFNKKVALIASFLMAIFWQNLFFSSRLMTEIPTLTFFLFTVYFFWKGYVEKQDKMMIWFGVFFGLSLLTRAATLMMTISFLLFFLAIDRFKFLKNKYLWISVFIVFLMMLPFFGFIYYKEHSNPFQRFLGTGEGRFNISNSYGLSGIIEYGKHFPEYLGNILLIPFVLGILLFFMNIFIGFDLILKNQDNENKKLFFLLCWFIVPFIYHTYTGDHVELRYLMMAFPPFFIILSQGLIKIEDWTKKYSKNLGIIILLAFLLLGAYYQINTAGKSISQSSTSYIEVKQAAEFMKQNSNPDAIIFSVSIPQTSYYAERKTLDVPVNESDFEENITKLKPAFFEISGYEQYPQWAFDYPQRHNQTLIPVKVYNRGENPILVVYAFKYE